MTQLPTLFISHGAPTLAIDDGPAHRFLMGCGKSLRKPNAILMLSAHFEAPTATVTGSTSPSTIYDFWGFPDALYDISYPASGDPALARRVSDLLSTAGIETHIDEDRGLDHGAWIPLSLMYPDADVPVVQLSIDARRGAAYHFRLGEILRPLRGEGVLIIGSGGATHNLSHAIHAPEAIRNHPTDEHFFPLMCAIGATKTGEPRRRIHASDTYGALAMDAYMLGAPGGIG